MKAPLATMALAATLASATLYAQFPAPAPGTTPPAAPNGTGVVTQPPPAPAPASARPFFFRRNAAGPRPPEDTAVTPASVVSTAPNEYTAATPDQLQAPTIPLPTDAIEPYLLTKDVGPFLVMAKSFRGPEAERFALALVLELRRDHHLPAWILRTKDFPGRSVIRNVPPNAPVVQDRAHLTDPEKVRTYDEAAVLVGNEKTLADSEKLLKVVKHIKPKCLDGLPSIYPWRHGQALKTALRTTNPFVPAQNLFPASADSMVLQMNGGPHSVYNCPGRYTLQIAEFGGRASFVTDDQKFTKNSFLGRSPLETAAADAEKLAEALTKDPDIRKMGLQTYVYHDRTASKVMIGSFQAPNDPNAAQVRDSLLRLAVPLISKKVTESIIVPAPQLTDLETIKPKGN